MKDKTWYSVFFVVVLCCVCALFLTAADQQWEKRITANKARKRTRAIVEALTLCRPETPDADALAIYGSEAVQKVEMGEMEVFEGRADGKLLGYAVEFDGMGKYGPIRGIIGVGADRQKLLGLRIYEQQETPGLGGEIASDWFLSQFAGLPFLVEGVPGIIISKTAKGPNVVDSITGASKTTYELGLVLNATLASFMSGGTQLEVLDLGVTPDKVTRATAGYPKKAVKPPHLREEVKRPPFMVPPGTVNLARGKKVSSSTPDPFPNELSQLVDDVKTCGEFDIVELEDGPQWIQVDLGAPHPIHAICVWHYYKNPIIYNDVVFMVSNDPEFKEGVTILFNNDHDNTLGFGNGKDTAFIGRWWGELVDAKGAEAQYVRVYTNGGASGEKTVFVELAVYGTP